MSGLRGLRDPQRGPAGLSRAGHAAREVRHRLGHRLLEPVPLLHEHLRFPHDPRPRAGGRHRGQARATRTSSVWIVTGDGDALSIGGNHIDPPAAAQRRRQGPALQQPDLRPDQGPVLAHLRAGQEDQVHPLRLDRPSVQPAVAWPWAPRRPSWPAASTSSTPHLKEILTKAARPPGHRLRRDLPELQHLQRRRLRAADRQGSATTPCCAGARRAAGLRQEPRPGHPPERAAARGGRQLGDGVAEEDLLVHDERNPNPAYAFLLSRMDIQSRPADPDRSPARGRCSPLRGRDRGPGAPGDGEARVPATSLLFSIRATPGKSGSTFAAVSPSTGSHRRPIMHGEGTSETRRSQRAGALFGGERRNRAGTGRARRRRHGLPEDARSAYGSGG